MRPRQSVTRMTAVLVAPALALVACSAPPQLSVDGVWVRLSPVPNRPAAAYFTLHGGQRDATLINVTTDVAVRSEMHQTVTGPGRVSEMRPLSSIVIPAGRDVPFQPGGRHVMLFNVNPGIHPGERRITLTFTFADGTRIQRNAAVLGAGDSAPQ